MPFYPNTNTRLLNVPIDPDNKYQIDFTSRDAQIAYMLSRTVPNGVYDGVTYQRKPDSGDIYIRVNKHVDTLWNCNYAMYRNTNFTDKWFFAFITRLEYINDQTTHVHLRFDAFQSWLFDFTILPSFVEREMITDDIPGNNTIDEQLEIGDYVLRPVQGTSTGANYLWSPFRMCLIVASTVALDLPSFQSVGVSQHGIPMGVRYYAFADIESGWTGGSLDELRSILQELNDSGKIDAIQHMFAYPADLVEISTDTHLEVVSTKDSLRKLFTFVEENTIIGNGTVGIGSYIPKNKKLLSFPYVKLILENNSGGSAEYRLEFFGQLKQFEIRYNNNMACPIVAYPLNYSNYSDDAYMTNALTMPPFPMTTWNSDTYSNWFAQNQASLNASGEVIQADYDMSRISATRGALNSAVSFLMGAFGSSIGMSTGGIETLLSGQTNYENRMLELNAKISDMKVLPPQGRGILTSSTAMVKDLDTFTLNIATLRPEHARIIDDYFDMFGYKTNRIKIPNTNTRSYWNYIKTVNVAITAAIPEEDANTIKGLFNNGFTIWHQPENVGNYSLNNH